MTRRFLTDHKIQGIDNKLIIEVMDSANPAYGNACHKYLISGEGRALGSVDFQEGTVKEVGLNGITNESLIVICLDRLRSFQTSPFACHENAVAITKLEEALMWLQKRTRDRLARDVEGTNQI